jgi:ATP-dependent DNA ligase
MPERAPDPPDSVDVHDQRYGGPDIEDRRTFAIPTAGATGRATASRAADARFASARRWRAILVDALRLATYSAAMPLPGGFVSPCVPTTASQPQSGDDWVHEIKQDGFRMMVRRDAARRPVLTKSAGL